MGYSIKHNHCTIFTRGPSEFVLEGGNGDTFVNGSFIHKGKEVSLRHKDRIAMGTELMILVIPAERSEGEDEVDVDEAFLEFSAGQEEMESAQAQDSSSSPDAELMKRIKELE